MYQIWRKESRSFRALIFIWNKALRYAFTKISMLQIHALNMKTNVDTRRAITSPARTFFRTSQDQFWLFQSHMLFSCRCGPWKATYHCWNPWFWNCKSKSSLRSEPSEARWLPAFKSFTHSRIWRNFSFVHAEIILLIIASEIIRWFWLYEARYKRCSFKIAGICSLMIIWLIYITCPDVPLHI
jgi:hypothetical protein